MKFFSVFLAVPICLALFPGLTAFRARNGPPIPYNTKFDYEEFREQFLHECFFDVGDQYWTDGGFQAVHLCGEIVNHHCQFSPESCTEPQIKLEAGYRKLKMERLEDKIEAETCIAHYKYNPFDPTCAGLVFHQKAAKNMTLREQIKLAYFDQLMQNEHKFVNMTATEIGSQVVYDMQAKYNGDFSEERLVINCFACRHQRKCPFCYGITWGFTFAIYSERRYVDFSPQQQKYIDMYNVIFHDWDKLKHVLRK